MKRKFSKEHDPKLAFLRKVTGSLLSDARGQVRTKRAAKGVKITLPRVSILERPDDEASQCQP